MARDVPALVVAAALLAACIAVSCCAPRAGKRPAATTTEQWGASSWSAARAGQPLDPIFYSAAPTLDDSFNVTGCPQIGTYAIDRPNPGFAWYTIAGVMGKGVDGQILTHDRSADDPYDCASGHLRIKLFYSTRLGKWVGGSIQSNDWSGDGKTFTYGYYEVAASLPAHWSRSLQPWMAIWLNGRVSTRANPQYEELDILEYLTRDDPSAVSVTMHQWPANAPRPGQLAYHRQKDYVVDENLWDGQVHRYGVLRSPGEECVVFDRKVQRCFPIYGYDMRGPMSILIDADIGRPPTDTTQTSEIDVMRASFYPCPRSHPRCI